MFAATRPAAVAGSFYPAHAQALREAVQHCLQDAAPVAAERAPKLLVVPHAGYVYSGPVAAHAYALLAPWRERFTRVVLLGPAHRVAVRGLAAPSSEFFATPLGRVRIDRAALAEVADLPQLRTSDAVHADEHSLEVQLPFLQSVLGDFALVPLAVGDASAEAVAQVIERLWGGDETLIVISSDLSHYLRYDEARAIDRDTVDRILRLDATLNHHQACGATPLAGATLAARAHGLQPRLLDLRNSGDTAGDRSRVVGYCAIAYEPADTVRDTPPAGDSAEQSALGRALLAHARNAIARELGLPVRPAPAHAELHRLGATFVTLRRHGELRGCIGQLDPRRRLDRDVRRNAVRAAFHDARFVPLATDEFAAVEIEVSLLDAVQPLPAQSEDEAAQLLRPGTDGVVIEWQGLRATLLPQVWSQVEGPYEFLAALKRKAGLPPDFWSPELRLSRYRVRKFAEAQERA